MANEHMETPTAEQASQIEQTMAALAAASKQSNAIANTISELRRTLNNARSLLGSLKSAIGTNSYPYGNDRRNWHTVIDEQMAAIDKAVK